MPVPGPYLPDYSGVANQLSTLGQSIGDTRRRNALAALLPDAMQGNVDSIGKVAQIDPSLGVGLHNNRLATALQMQTAEREQKKFDRDQALATAKWAAGMVAGAKTPEAKARAYALARPSLVALGGPFAAIPEAYDDSVGAAADSILERLPDAPKAPPLEHWQNPDGSINPELYEAEKGLKTAATQLRIDNPTAPGSDPSFQLFYGPDGKAFSFDRRTQAVTPLGITGAPYDPSLAASVAAGRASGTAQGKAQGEAAATLPATIQSGEYALGVIDQLLKSPGRTMITGGSSVWQTAKIPGTESANAKALLDQIQGQAFLEAFESLKGSGQITEVEGNKATQAKARLSTAQTDKEFESALLELRDVVNNGLENARRKARTPMPRPTNEPAGAAQVLDWNELP